MKFTYGYDKKRKKTAYYQGGTINKTRYYIGSYEKDSVAGSVSKEIDYIYLPDGEVVVLEKTGASRTTRFVHTDHLGSFRTVTAQNKAILAQYTYDPWGIRTLRSGTDLGLRGFTGHEHLDDFGLINMNARLYDPVLGRFLGVDPYVQLPDFTQNFNRYSYALNNPLVYIDPEGEFILIAVIGAALAAGLGAAQGAKIADAKGVTGGKKFGYILAGMFISGAAAAASAGVGIAVSSAIQVGGFLGGAAVGAAAGATAGFTSSMGMSLLNGDEFGQALVKGFMGAGMGAVGGALIGGLVSGIDAAIDKRDFWHGGKLTTDISMPIPEGVQEGMFDCNYEVAEQIDAYYGNNRDHTYFQSLEPGKDGQGLRLHEVGKMYGKAGYAPQDIAIDLQNPINTTTDIANSMSNNNAVVLNYDTGVRGYTPTGEPIKFGHATAVTRVRIYDNGRFVIKVMNPSTGRTSFRSLKSIKLLFRVK